MPAPTALPPRKHFFDAYNDDETILLAVVSDASLDAPLRFSSNPTEMFSLDPMRCGTTHRGEQYGHMYMTLTGPAQREGADCTATLDLANIEGSGLIGGLRELPAAARVDLTEVMRSNPDAVIDQMLAWRLSNVTYGVEGVSLALTRSRRLDAPFPYRRFTPVRAPGLFP